MVRNKAFFNFLIAVFIFGCGLSASETKPVFTLSLEDSEELALGYSYALKAAEKGSVEAKGKTMSAYSNVLPSISGSFNKKFSDTYASKRASESRDQFSKLYTGSLTATQPIYSGGKAIAGLRSAKYYRQSVSEDIRLERHRLLFAVRQSYYKILLDKEMLKVAAEQLKLAEKYLDDVKKRRNIETATNYDVLRAEVEKTNESTALTAAENNLNKSSNNFLRLLGLPLNSSLKLTDKLAYTERSTPAEEELYEKALSYRPELRKSSYSIKMQKESISASRAELMPQLSASGTYSGTSDVFDKTANEYDKSWEVGLTLSLNIFDGLLYYGQIKEKKAAKEKLEYQHMDLKDQVKLEVRNAVLDINSAASTVKSQEKNVNQATESLRLTVARERQGVSTHLDVLTSRQTLAVAQRNFYQSIYIYKNAWNSLALAIGEIEKESAPDSSR
ncbi:MAG: TolC family protein [Planctomycetota bacterium]